VRPSRNRSEVCSERAYAWSLRVEPSFRPSCQVAEGRFRVGVADGCLLDGGLVVAPSACLAPVHAHNRQAYPMPTSKPRNETHNRTRNPQPLHSTGNMAPSGVPIVAVFPTVCPGIIG
jgi:hypothetical protein